MKIKTVLSDFRKFKKLVKNPEDYEIEIKIRDKTNNALVMNLEFDIEPTPLVINDELHPDIVAALDEPDATLSDIVDVENAVEIYGSWENFKKFLEKCTEEDAAVIKQFNKIVANYIHMQQVLKGEI